MSTENTYPFSCGSTMVVLRGKLRSVDFVDVYEPDPSVGILGEPGWYIVTAADGEELFLSATGVVYAGDPCTEEVGEHLGLRGREALTAYREALDELRLELGELREELGGLTRAFHSRTDNLT